jgi:hypothetical protein
MSEASTVNALPSRVWRSTTLCLGLVLVASAEGHAQTARRGSGNTAAKDSADALVTFRENIAAIHQRDQARYLATYVHTDRLVRHSPAGMETGYENWPARKTNAWPDTLIVREMRVTPIAPGVVYGYYRYIGVPAPGDTLTGVSTRVFVRTPEGMRITVSASWNDPVPPARKE